MIWLFNSTNRVSASYKTFEEVCDHFRRVEHLKPVPEGSSYNEDRWDFTYWPHKRLSSLHEHLKDTHFSHLEREAFEGELDLIEIFDGRSELADQYIVTPDLDVTSLMREWCFDYAYAHGYTILETFTPELCQSSFLVAYHTSQGVSCGSFLETFREGSQP